MIVSKILPTGCLDDRRLVERQRRNPVGIQPAELALLHPLGDRAVSLAGQAVAGGAERIELRLTLVHQAFGYRQGECRGGLAVHAAAIEMLVVFEFPAAIVPGTGGRMARPSANSGLACCDLYLGWKSMSWMG